MRRCVLDYVSFFMRILTVIFRIAGTSPESQGIVNSILTATPNLTTEGRYLLVSGAPLSMEMSGTVNVDAAALTNVEQSLKTLNVMYIILVK